MEIFKFLFPKVFFSTFYSTCLSSDFDFEIVKNIEPGKIYIINPQFQFSYFNFKFGISPIIISFMLLYHYYKIIKWSVVQMLLTV